MALTLFSSCNSGRSEEEAEVLSAVKGYNIALTQMHRDLFPKYMEPFATKKEIKKLDHLLDPLRYTQSRMISRQDDFNVKSIEIDEQEATLTAKEKWTYWWESLFTKEVTKEKTEVKYTVIYKLVKENNVWKVNELSSDTPEKEKGFEPKSPK